MLGGVDLIVWGLEEPCSHFAILFFGKTVFHSTLTGVEVVKYSDFLEYREVVFEKEFEAENEKDIFQGLRKFKDYKYDWTFFFWLVWSGIKLKFFRIALPDRIKKQQNGGILCTEALSLLPDNVRPDIDYSTITTPYKLWKALK